MTRRFFTIHILSRSKKTSTSLTLVKRKLHFFPVTKDAKWRSTLGKLDASSVGTLQKYLVIAFDIETGCWRVLLLTCKLSIIEDGRFVFIIKLMLSHIFVLFLESSSTLSYRVCGIFKYTSCFSYHCYY